MSLNNGAGIQKPIIMITRAKPTTEDFFQRQVSAEGRPWSGPRTRVAMWVRDPEKIATRKVTNRIASKIKPRLNPPGRIVNHLRNKLNGGAPGTAGDTMIKAAP